MSLSSLSVGKSPDDPALLNTRNFDYYRNERKVSTCQFDGEMDSGLNPGIEVLGTWRTWPCPPKFRAEDILVAQVMATLEHRTHLAGLTKEERVDFVKVIQKKVLLTASGPILGISLGPQALISEYPIHAEIVVPDLTQRVQAIFSPNLATEGRLPQVSSTLKIGRWSWDMYQDFGFGLKERHIIRPTELLTDFGQMETSDFVDILDLACLLAGQQGRNLRGGTFLMGFPGKAFTTRFGDTTYTVASQPHIHGNDKELGTNGIVAETLAKKPADIEEKRAVLVLWERMFQHVEKNPEATEAEAMTAVLTDDEQKFLENRKK